MAIIEGIAIALALISVVPVVMLFLETMLALWPGRGRRIDALPARQPCAILIPAHNEEYGIAATVAAVQRQLAVGDRIVVVADNCDDATAQRAREAGADVTERHDSDRRGKGFALEHGLRHLQASPPAVVVVLDADGRLQEEALEWLVRVALHRKRPQQAIYTEILTADGTRERWSAFAMMYKNAVRPLGLYRVGAPCLLTGSGMAFPWHTLQQAQLGTADIVEDMSLGIELARMGHSPELCPEAQVTAETAPNLKALQQQRTRWEHGHVQTLVKQVPRLALAGLLQGRPALCVLALELAVPPLSMLLMILILMAGLSLGLAWVASIYAPALITCSGLITLTITIGAAWLGWGMRLISPKNMLLLPVYVLWKLPIYTKLLLSRQRKWNRTERRSTP